MLIHDRIAPPRWVEQAGAENAFGKDQHQSDAENRRCQNLYPGSGIEGPDKKRNPAPGHSLCPQTMDSGNKVESGQD